MSDDNSGTLSEPIRRFREWLQAAREAEGIPEPTAMTLATIDPKDRPSERIVLLKDVDERGFVFYSNRFSRKGRALEQHPMAALLFYWPPLRRQVNIEGAVVGVDAEEADAYWTTRPRESQIGSCASAQSEPLAERDDYEQRAEQYRRQYEGEPIPRPAHWIGYRVVPDRIEFWEERAFRQHHRECYFRGSADEAWDWTLLNP